MGSVDFTPHKNAPGPPRLHMEMADGSGKVNTDIQFVADRQAILNTITAYSYFFDEGRWEELFALFSEDVVFETTTPEIGTGISHGKKVFRELFQRASKWTAKNSYIYLSPGALFVIWPGAIQTL